MLKTIRVEGISNIQKKIIQKLFQSNAFAYSKEIEKYGFTATALAKGRDREDKGLNKNLLVAQLPQLVELGLLKVKSIEKKTQKDWKYYALTKIGYFYAIKLRVDELEDNLQKQEITKNEFKEILTDLLSRIRDMVPIIVGNKTQLEEFGDVFYFSLKQAMISFDFEIRNELYLPFRTLVLKSALPKKSGFGNNIVEQWFPIFDSSKEQESLITTYREQGLDLSNVGIMDPSPIQNRMREFSEIVGDSIVKEIELTIEKNIAFMVFYFLNQNIRVILNILKMFNNKFGKNKKYDLKKLDKFKEEFMQSGNNMLRALGQIDELNNIDEAIEQLEKYENKIKSLISKKKKQLLEIQNELLSVEENYLILVK